eukprot:7560896-Pyramimonas_sp.AAC.1
MKGAGGAAVTSCQSSFARSLSCASGGKPRSVSLWDISLLTPEKYQEDAGGDDVDDDVDGDEVQEDEEEEEDEDDDNDSMMVMFLMMMMLMMVMRMML